MATERVSGKKAAKKDKSNVGHNLTQIRKGAVNIFERLERLDDEFASARGEHAVDKGNLFDEGADKLGISRKLLRSEYARYLYNKAEEAREKELEVSERDAIDTLRAAFEGTPFEDYVAGKLAKPTREELAERKAAEKAEEEASAKAANDKEKDD